jgi:hypothetical protein
MTEVCSRPLPLDGGSGRIADVQVFPILGEIELALNKLPSWMRDEGRMWDASLFFKPMSELSIMSADEGQN